jgi:hypothetical protein
MDDKKVFYKLLREDLYPKLRKCGFKGSGQHFKRVDGDVIHAINIQNDKYGGSCCLNLGLHLSFLPIAWPQGQMPELDKIKEVDCSFRKRLTPKEKSDYWWKFKGSGLFSSKSETVEHLVSTYFEEGETEFEKYDTVDKVASMIPMNRIESDEYIQVFGGVVPVHGALTMARINKHLNRVKLCRDYARLGLKVMGQAKALKPELEALANET